MMIVAIMVGMLAIMLAGRQMFPKAKGRPLGRGFAEGLFVNGVAAVLAITALVLGATMVQVAIGLVGGFVIFLLVDRKMYPRTEDGESDNDPT
ncbi:MAG: hypothetical protein AAF409_02465 [Pseudomonadota bacterium]